MILAIFWCVFGLAAILDVSWSITLFFVSLAFGSLAIVPPSVTGGVTFLPVTACSFLLAIKAFLTFGRPVALQDGLLNPNRLGLLTAFMVMSLIVTYTAPILFQGVPVMAFNASAPSGLTLSAGNITQPLYIVASFLVTLSLYQIALDPRGRQALFKGIMIGGLVAVFAGVCDLAFAGTTLLAPVRTATYAMMNGDAVAGYRRVIGFDTEASAYGALTVGFLALIYFMRVGRAVGGWFARIETPLVVALIAFTLLSTSSAAYLGLILFFACALLANIVSRGDRDEITYANVEILGLLAVVAVVVAIAIVKPSIVSPLGTIIESSLFKKAGSSSFEERSMWNAVSLEGFRQTFGYGVGIGSTRASSWPVAVLSSCGVLGAGLIVALFLRLMTVPLNGRSGALYRVATGSRFGLLVASAPSLTAGTLVDFGPYNATLFALAAALPLALDPPRWMHWQQPAEGEAVPS